MSPTVTWLHLSDLHMCKPTTGWDAKRVTDTLCKDLKKMQQERGLKPDLIFFTGDAAYGHIGSSGGKSIGEQFRDAHDFFTAVRQSFEPAIEQRNIFLVPGNHDVNRNEITDFETEWLLNSSRKLDEINSCIQSGNANWKQLMKRLDDYACFLETYGYDHLLTGRDRLIYADAREINGLRVGIAGFNSAWSSRGKGREEMGRLWMAGRFQLETLDLIMPPHDFKIALLHHPSNWLFPEENPSFGRQLEGDFRFVLHGHEHQDFVKADGSNGHTVISAGACHEWSESKNNGYNLVKLDFESGTGEVWLRQYESTGGGWVSRNISGRKNDRGCLHLTHLQPWISKIQNSIIVKPNSAGELDPKSIEIPAEIKLDRAADYEPRYRKAVADKLDYMQLFGIDIPRDSKEYSLSVAYVSLNLSDEDCEDLESDDEEAIGQTILPAERVFDDLAEQGRLLIRGVAGSGKTTLLRWAAVQAGRTESKSEATGKMNREFDSIEHMFEKFDRQSSKSIKLENLRDEGKIAISFAFDRYLDLARDWRQKVPFIIRLRDYSEGKLPRPQEFPLLLAKELSDPPAHWIDDILNNGRALIMFDGVDEVPQQYRDATMREIRALINAYPDNYYVVTTRPEAVERLEFRELGFVSARVEPMAVNERNEFIDRWHEAMEVRLKSWQKPEDLRPLAQRLKHRLENNPAIARLTTNPLLCAVVCTLNRSQYENLPDTPVDLCEKLCLMLLDRRDKERLNPEARKWIDAAYGKLDFRMRKGILSQLAHYMVMEGKSAISEPEADRQIAQALVSYQSTNLRPDAIRRALVERSGMLQESSEQKIEFIHNTLKEFLAAERLVNIGNVDVLADRSEEAAWQPVILFALALPRDGSSFATDLLLAILQRTPLDKPAKGSSKAAKLAAAKIRSQQFFFLRCHATIYQIDRSHHGTIQAAFDRLSQELLPPRSMTDAAVLAACGEAIVPYLKNRSGLKATERAACVRTLGLIGNSQAKTLLQDYLNDSTLTVAQELAPLIDDWNQIPAIVKYIDVQGELSWQFRQGLHPDLSQITHLPNLTKFTSLYLSRRPVSDISVLAQLPNLTSLDLSYTQVSDISALAQLTNLTSLNLMETQVSDISALAQLPNLTSLNLWGTQVSDISALAQLPNLTSLDLWGTQVSDISALAQLTNLTSLNLWGTQVSDISALAQLPNLTTLYLSGTQVSDISALAQLTSLIILDLSGTQVSDISALAHLTNLNIYR